MWVCGKCVKDWEDSDKKCWACGSERQKKESIENISLAEKTGKAKEEITSKEFAKRLLYVLKKSSDHFYEYFGQCAQAILGVELDEKRLVTRAREVYMINLWIISKVLSSDKKILDDLHKIYLLPHSSENQIKQWLEQRKTESLKNVLKQDENELRERYTKYYADWDDKSGGNQSVLAITMLEYIFNMGQPNKRFIDIRLIAEINMHILGMMKLIVDIRKEYEIVG